MTRHRIPFCTCLLAYGLPGYLVAFIFESMVKVMTGIGAPTIVAFLLALSFAVCISLHAWRNLYVDIDSDELRVSHLLKGESHVLWEDIDGLRLTILAGYKLGTPAVITLRIKRRGKPVDMHIGASLAFGSSSHQENVLAALRSQADQRGISMQLW